MAGLDSRGAFDGFVQGFGLMQNYQDGKDRKAYMQQQQAIQQRGLDMREQEFSAQQDDRQSQRDQQQIAQFYTGWSSGVEAPITPELDEAFKRTPMMDPRHLFRPETEAAVQYADKLAKGEGSLFSQQTVDAMNDFYAPRVNRGGGGKKRLAGMYPGQKEGSFVFELEVEDEQGSKRLAPMTVNRGLEGEDDEVAQYEIDQAIGPVMGAKSLYQALGQNRDKMLGYLRSSGYLPKEEERWEAFDGPDGSILKRNQSGDVEKVLGRKSDGASGLTTPTSQQKNYQFLIGQLGYSPEEAYQAAFGGTAAVNGRIPDSAKLGLQLLNTQIKELDAQTTGKAGMQLEENELAALQQERAALAAQRAALAQGLGLSGVPAQQSAQAQPAQPQAAQQVGPQPGQVEDGYRFLGGDPASPENWSKQ